MLSISHFVIQQKKKKSKIKLKVPSKQESEAKLMAWQTTELKFIYCTAAVGLCDHY